MRRRFVVEAFSDRLNYELDVVLRFLGREFDFLAAFASGHPLVTGIVAVLLFSAWLLNRQDPLRPE
ncbi:MAG TPA: hypothetical protein VEJ86_10940 [Candidatus Binataceae bacterium]|nr:hypothetical protein [Candidatus Binataceae bacterium]